MKWDKQRAKLLARQAAYDDMVAHPERADSNGQTVRVRTGGYHRPGSTKK